MQFFQKQVEFLVLIAGTNEIRVDTARVEVINNWPKPKSITELRGFIGLVQFFRRFVKDFSGISNPLTDLTKKSNAIRAWNISCDMDFNKMKQVLSTAPVLIAPNWAAPFTIHVDTSEFSVGGTLTQDAGRH